MKAEAEEATEDTRKDVEKLRKLHAKRVEKLEGLLREERERLAEARTQLGGLQLHMGYVGMAGGDVSYVDSVVPCYIGLLGKCCECCECCECCRWYVQSASTCVMTSGYWAQDSAT